MKFKDFFEKILYEEEDSLNGKSPQKIWVYGGEGTKPHLHYRINGVEGCIRLDIPRYFCHESYHEGLNSQDRKFMIGWLKLNWKKCVRKWNQDTAQEKIQDEIIPQYDKLPKLQPNGKLAPEDRK